MNGDGTVYARGLRKCYGDRVVLGSIDLDVQCGEIVCIIGPSGSGKSTLLRCIDGLEEVDRGILRVNGEDLGFVETDTAYRARNRKEVAMQRTRIGMVFQQFNLFPNMTARENVMAGPVLVKGVAKKAAATRADSLLADVGLAGHGDHYPWQLSGGQKQRVAIARALAMDPNVMLFDEPTSALDPIATGRIEELVHELRERVTIIIVTHNMQQAARVSDYTGFMYLGELVEFDRTENIFHNPSSKLTEEYITGRFG